MGSRGYDLVWGTLLRTTTVLHRILDRASGGRLGRRFPGGQQVVWITTLGRKSGEWRRTPLLAVREDGDPAKPWVVTGSNAGQSAVPGWVFNARAHAFGTLEVDGVTSEVRFEEVLGEERARLYAQLAEKWAAYAMYERHAGREIPVFRILPRTDTGEDGSRMP
jgi:deazaflavin-dependent oxidoreductase (nitroreductase family)